MRDPSPGRHRRLLLSAALLAGFLALDVFALSLAAGWGYKGHAQLFDEGDQKSLAIPFEAPAGATVRIPSAVLFERAGLHEWVSLRVGPAGTAAAMAANGTPTIFVQDEAPLSGAGLEFKSPGAAEGRFEAVYSVNVSGVPAERRAAIESAFIDRLEPSVLYGDEAVKYVPGWFRPLDVGLRLGAAASLLLLGSALVPARAGTRLTADAQALEALAGLAYRAKSYALQLRNLLALSVVLFAATGVFGSIAFGYFVDEWQAWAPPRPWADLAILGVLVASITFVATSASLFWRAHRELDRLRGIRTPDL